MTAKLFSLFYFIFNLVILYATESDHQFHLKPTFVETFDYYDQNLWTQENGTFLCNLHNRMKNCVLTSGGNLGYITVDDHRMKNKRHMMTMWLLNNCDFDDCCIREKKCTHFTAGYIQSKQKFTYGVYVFVSRAIPHNVRGISHYHSTICITKKSWGGDNFHTALPNSEGPLMCILFVIINKYNLLFSYHNASCITWRVFK